MLVEVVKIWGTVWGTTVPEHEFFDPKTGLTSRAKSFIPSNRRWDFIHWKTVVCAQASDFHMRRGHPSSAQGSLSKKR
jgi:hypothetical protein